MDPEHRPDPDELLRRLEAEQAEESHGRLKVFLGYASGVGKSFRMLDEARRRKARGEDVVIGALQRKRDPALQQLVDQFELVPPLVFGTAQEAIDVDAILRRRPQVCLIDGLAQDNPKPCRNRKRYQDALEILSARIAVITAVNIQYIEELSPQVKWISGKTVTETVPKEFVLAADEIEIVDISPEQVIERVGRQPDETAAAAERRRLSELREIALLLAAEVVDHQLGAYLEDHCIQQPIFTQERILVCITPRAHFEPMITAGRRIRDRFHGELFVVYVEQHSVTASDRAGLQDRLDFARDAGAHVEVLTSKEPVDAILRYARQHHITQIFIGHSLRQNWRARLLGTPVDTLIRKAEGMDVCIFPH
jgi:two-component system, OmpR family, sensor histidine kinase KdpD